MRTRYFFVAIIVLLLLTACGAGLSEEAVLPVQESAAPVVEQQIVVNPENPEPVAEVDSEIEQEPSTEIDEAEQPAEAEAETVDTEATTVDRPAWQLLALTDARTGESFTLADFAGKTIFVEPMATWCSNCRRQLNNVRDATFQFEEDEVVFIGLSVETNLDDASLAQYAKGSSFDWPFAVATPELLQGLADEFGRASITPPATPHFIIRPDGSFTDLVTGIEPAGQIVAQIQAAQG